MHLAYERAGAFNLVNAFSGFGGFCHVELVFSNGDTLRASYGELVTLEQRDHSGHGWELEPIDVDAIEETTMRIFAEREIGSPYDTNGVLRFVLPWMKENPHDWFCSEICTAALQRVNRLLPYDAWKVSPNALRKLNKTPQYFGTRP